MDIQKIKSSFQLISTAMSALHITNSVVEYSERLDGARDIDVSYDIVKTQLLEEDSLYFGTMNLHIVLNCEVEDRGFSINLTLQGGFIASSELGEDEFCKMMKINGCAALYSIARASISCISTQMFSIGNVILPLANFIHFHELEEQSANPES